MKTPARLYCPVPRLALSLIAPMIMGLGIASDAAAQKTYRWTDEQGQVHFSDLPPPPTARKKEEKQYNVGGSDNTPSFAVRKAAGNFPVVLYSSDNCGDLCVSARDLLKKRGIPFSERKIVTAEDMAAYRERLGAPEEVPAVTIGTLTQKGFDGGRWNRMLDDAGYPRTALPGAAATPDPATPAPTIPAPATPAPAAPAPTQ